MPGSFEPIKIRSDEVAEVEREPLFYVDDQEFTIPKEVPPNITVRFLQDVLDKGHEYAVAAAMEAVLTPEALAALADTDAVTADQIDQIMTIVEDKVAGQMGKSRRGRRR